MRHTLVIYGRAHQNRLQLQNSVKPASFIGIGDHPSWLQLQFDWLPYNRLHPQHLVSLKQFTVFTLIATVFVPTIQPKWNRLHSQYLESSQQDLLIVFGLTTTGFIHVQYLDSLTLGITTISQKEAQSIYTPNQPYKCTMYNFCTSYSRNTTIEEISCWNQFE